MPKLAVVTLVCLGLIVIYNAVIAGKAAARGSNLAKASEPFSRRLQNPLHTILVVGDSTAVGTGASSPRDSIAGRIAADFPETTVLNQAQDGALTAAVPAQIESAAGGNYDIVLIQVGGNDALRFTGKESLRQSMTQSLQAASAASTHVVLLSIGDLGEAPSVPWPLSLLFSYRSHVVRDVFKEIANRNGAHFIDLLALSGNGSPFKEQTDKYYAMDGLHPSSAGYGVWYQSVRESVSLSQWLSPKEVKP